MRKTKWKHPLYGVWKGMRARCLNPKHEAYERYAGRGIVICDQWADFWAFVDDMPPRPTPTHQLDRIDNDGNYEPSNVRWADQKTQHRNKRSNRLITHNGVTRCLSEWEEVLGFRRGLLKDRLRHGWDHERALTCPVRAPVLTTGMCPRCNNEQRRGRAPYCRPCEAAYRLDLRHRRRQKALAVPPQSTGSHPALAARIASIPDRAP